MIWSQKKRNEELPNSPIDPVESKGANETTKASAIEAGSVPEPDQESPQSTLSVQTDLPVSPTPPETVELEPLEAASSKSVAESAHGDGPSKKIHVRGDVAITWINPESSNDKSRYIDASANQPKPRMGGAWYLRDLIDTTLSAGKAKVPKSGRAYLLSAIFDHQGAFTIQPIGRVHLKISHIGGILLTDIAVKKKGDLTISGYIGQHTDQSCNKTFPIHAIQLSGSYLEADAALQESLKKIQKRQQGVAEVLTESPDISERPHPVDISIEILDSYEVTMDRCTPPPSDSKDDDEYRWKVQAVGLMTCKPSGSYYRIRSAHRLANNSLTIIRRKHNNSIFRVINNAPPLGEGHCIRFDKEHDIIIRSLSISCDDIGVIKVPIAEDENRKPKKRWVDGSKLGHLIKPKQTKKQRPAVEVKSYQNRSRFAFHEDYGIFRAYHRVMLFPALPTSKPSDSVYRIASVTNSHRLKDGMNRPRLLIDMGDSPNEVGDGNSLSNSINCGGDPDILVINDLDLSFRRSKARYSERKYCRNFVEKQRDCPARGLWFLATVGGSLPHQTDPFWKNIPPNGHHTTRRVFVVGIGELRRSGWKISRRVSIDATVLSIREILDGSSAESETLKYLARRGFLIIRIGDAAAAIVYSKQIDDGAEYYLRFVFDGDRSFFNLRDTERQGYLVGNGSHFIAALTKKILQSTENKKNERQGENSGGTEADQNGSRELEIVTNGTKCGLTFCRKAFQAGFGSSEEEFQINYLKRWTSAASVSVDDADLHRYRKIDVPEFSRCDGNTPRWSILRQAVFGPIVDTQGQLTFRSLNVNEQLWKEKIFPIGLCIAQNGLSKAFNCSLDENSKCPTAPIVRYGPLTLVGRDDVESYAQVVEVIRRHINTGPTKPVSMAVFGSPGSGKSFGVESIAKGLCGDRLRILNLNVSQYDNLEELSRDLIKVSDVSAQGLVPLVFFDEFDCKRRDGTYWFSSFLQPMQDGTFVLDSSVVTLGPAIFVFAGGTAASLRCFRTAHENEPVRKARDFISRLSAHLNIHGLDAVNLEKGVKLRPYIRRGILLRSLLERAGFVDQLSGDTLVDDDILSKWIESDFVYGARSMEKVIGLCTPYAGRITHASLPSDSILNTHLSSG